MTRERQRLGSCKTYFGYCFQATILNGQLHHLLLQPVAVLEQRSQPKLNRRWQKMSFLSSLYLDKTGRKGMEAFWEDGQRACLLRTYVFNRLCRRGIALLCWRRSLLLQTSVKRLRLFLHQFGLLFLRGEITLELLSVQASDERSERKRGERREKSRQTQEQQLFTDVLALWLLVSVLRAMLRSVRSRTCPCSSEFSCKDKPA